MRTAKSARRLGMLLVLGLLPAFGALLYYTGFETSEGYNKDLTLAGQRGWTGDSLSGNGLVENYLPDSAQQAFIGFEHPANISGMSVWRPIDFAPVGNDAQIVKFTTQLQFFDSTKGGYDEFRWSAYNRDGVRLFSVNFWNRYQRIYIELQSTNNQTGTNVFDTGLEYAFAQEAGDAVYELEIWMDFNYNVWTALLNGVVLANAEPITRNNSALDLGDIAAEWAFENPAEPGDNYMVFDDYTVTTEPVSAIPAVLESLGRNAQGHYSFNVHGQPDVTYAIEVTGDFKTWDVLQTYPNEGGTFTFVDDTAQQFQYGFYRLREIWQ